MKNRGETTRTKVRCQEGSVEKFSLVSEKKPGTQHFILTRSDRDYHLDPVSLVFSARESPKRAYSQRAAQRRTLRQAVIQMNAPEQAVFHRKAAMQLAAHAIGQLLCDGECRRESGEDRPLSLYRQR